MENEKHLQAKNLFFQTELTKTQIAHILKVSRRSISYWVKDGDWDRLRQSARHLPSMLAENCYHIVGHLTEHFLSERRLTNPVSNKDADTLHKLASTINKLKNRSTLNESMEMFGYFLEMLRNKNEKLAEEIMPYIDEHMSTRASVYAVNVQPDHFTAMGRIPWPDPDDKEAQIDRREAFYNDPYTIETYERAGIPLPSDEEIISPPTPQDPPPAPYSLAQRNAENAEKARAFTENHSNKTFVRPQPVPAIIASGQDDNNEICGDENQNNEEPSLEKMRLLAAEAFAYLAQNQQPSTPTLDQEP